MAHRPSPAHCLFLYLRFYWTTATPIHLHAVFLSGSDDDGVKWFQRRPHGLQSQKIFTTKYWLFIGKTSPLPSFKEATHFLQIPPIFHRCPFPAAGCCIASASDPWQVHALSLPFVTLTVLKSAAQVFSRMSLIRGLSHLGRGYRCLGRGSLRRDTSISLCPIRGTW